MDNIFAQEPLEYYQGGEISSTHGGEANPYDMPNSYVLFCYPRDFTPVCTGELIELEKRLGEFGDLEVIAASTDSPEAHNLFFNDHDAFPPEQVANIHYPVLSLKHSELTTLGQRFILDEWGYSNRVALYVKYGVLRATYCVTNEESRNIDVLLSLIQ